MIRAGNSWLNLYDVEDIPDELVDRGMEGILDVFDFLGIPAATEEVDGEEVIMKFLVPEDFDAWLLSKGGTSEDLE